MSKKNTSEYSSDTHVSSASRFSQLIREGALIGWVLVCAYLLLCLVTYSDLDGGWSRTAASDTVHNAGGPYGAWIADVFFVLFGFLAYLFPMLVALRIMSIFRAHRSQESKHDWIVFCVRSVGLLLIMIAGSAIAHLNYTHTEFGPMGPGGVLGALVGGMVYTGFAATGSNLLMLGIFLFGITLFTGLSWLELFDRTGAFVVRSCRATAHAFMRWQQKRAEKREIKAQSDARDIKVAEVRAAKQTRQKVEITPPKPVSSVSERLVREKQATLFDDLSAGSSLPTLELLDAHTDADKRGYSAESLEAMSRLLELKLEDFGIEAVVKEVLPGPVVTRFEIQPAAGTKVSKITNLAKDLARSLAVVSVRVVEVIPGKSVVGIEIPNEKREMVRLSQVLSSIEFDQSKSPLTLALGHDISGQTVIADLGRMPHLLVAGTTGSGKSVAVNVMLLSLLYKSTPDQVRLILVDPKMLELAVYEGIPHLLSPVITDMKDAANALRWCVGEMERRYKLMSHMGVRNLAGFNRKINDAKAAGEVLTDPTWHASEYDIAYAQATDTEVPSAPELNALPNIVVVVDEFADMMMIVDKKKVEQLIARIAQKARAAGIHLILATQRPSVDVITGLIKANVPSRIGFQVSSRIDSRTILDQGGAEQLLGHGDMLYLPAGTSTPNRVHGAFVDDHEVHRVVDKLRESGEPNYVEGLTSEETSADVVIPGYTEKNTGGEGNAEESDPLYDEAVEFVCESRKASISSVQRKLRIGYNRAARLVEAMEAAGVVSEMQPNGNREVLAPKARN